MKDPQKVLRRLEQVRAETLRRLESLTQDELDWRPPPADGEEEWSLSEVFMHLATDELYLRELIVRSLLEGIQPPEGVRFLPPPPPYGMSKDVIRFWFERARIETRCFFNNWPSEANLDVRHEEGWKR